MRRLIAHAAEVLFFAFDRVGFRRHRLGDAFVFLAQELPVVDLVFAPVEGDAQQRLAEGVPIGRIEIEEVAAIGLDAGIRREAHRRVVLLRGRAFPRCAPARRPGRDRMIEHRTATARTAARHAATDEIESGVVEIIAVVIVERDVERTRAHVRLEVLAFEVHRRAAEALIGVVAPDDALTGGRIVHLADAREQQQIRVVQRERGEKHHVGGLEDFGAGRVDVGDTGGFLARRVGVDFHHARVTAQFVLRFFQEHRQQRGLQRTFR